MSQQQEGAPVMAAPALLALAAVPEAPLGGLDPMTFQPLLAALVKVPLVTP
jgi:hypothetical protein